MRAVNALSVCAETEDPPRRQDLRDEFPHGLPMRRSNRPASSLRRWRRSTYEGRTGTEVTFTPGRNDLHHGRVRFKTLDHRLRELAFLNSGVRIMAASDRRHPSGRSRALLRGWPRGFVSLLDKAKVPPSRAPIMLTAEKDDITVELAMRWTNSYHENVLCFTNNVLHRDGGTHLAGLRGALTRQVTGLCRAGGKTSRRRRSSSPATTRAKG